MSVPPVLLAKGRLVRSTVVGLISLGLLLVAWRHVARVDHIAPVTFSPGDIVLALAGGALFLLGRTWRTHALLGGRAPWKPLLGQTGVSWGAGLLLPGPSADATFIVLARRLGIGVRRSTSAAVIGRVLDIISLALIVVVASAVLGIDETRDAIVVTAAVGLVFLAVLIGVLSRPGRGMLVSIIRRIPKVRHLADDAADSVRELSGLRQILTLSTATVVCRIATLIEYAALFAMVGVHLDLWTVWLVLALRTFLSTIPVQGIAGLGTGQLWWTGALIFAGMSASTAIGVSITVSLLDLAASVPLCAVSWLVMRRSEREFRSELSSRAVAGRPVARAVKPERVAV